MDTQSINDAMRNVLSPTHFLGVFPASHLPVISESDKYPFCFIANTDGVFRQGAHWVSFYFDSRGVAHYFDSFGQAPYYSDWINYLSGNSRDGIWDYFKVQIQPYDSPFCGKYCIYYLIKRHFSPLHISDFLLMDGVSEKNVVDLYEAIT